MSNDKATTPTRRTVLKMTGAAAATAFGTPAVSARPDSLDQPLPDGTRVFLGGNTDFELPTGVERTGLGNADLAVVAPKTSVSRGNLVAALKQGKPVAFAGTRAFDGVLSTVYDVPHDEAEQAVRSGRPNEGSDLPYSFGFEYSFGKQSSVALVVPGTEALNTSRLAGDRVDKSTVFGYLGSELTTADGGAMTSDAELTASTPECPINLDNASEWDCLGYDKIDPDSTSEFCPYGPYQRIQWGVKLTNGSNEPNDYFGFETRMRITAGEADAVDCSSDAWESTLMTRTQTFNDGVVEEFGPDTVKGDYGESESVGFDISASADSIGAGVSVQWSNSESQSGVKTFGDIGGAEEQVDYEFDIKPDGNVGGSTLTTWLGQRVRVDSGTDSTDYSYDEQFKWIDRCTGWICSDNHHTEHNYGTAYWNA